jgi:hypothetical protein
LRATSFDLILFRIPYVNLDPDQPQIWDEGVGYDYFDDQVTGIPSDKNYSDRPSQIGLRLQQLRDVATSGSLYDNTNTGVYLIIIRLQPLLIHNILNLVTRM